MITATVAGAWIFAKFPKLRTPRQLAQNKNFWFRIALSHIPPRDERFEYERDIGMAAIPHVLAHTTLRVAGDPPSLDFFFPERWMSTQEEQAFVYRLMSHPQLTGLPLVRVDIVTKSPLLIGSFIRDDILIISDQEKK